MQAEQIEQTTNQAEKTRTLLSRVVIFSLGGIFLLGTLVLLFETIFKRNKTPVTQEIPITPLSKLQRMSTEKQWNALKKSYIELGYTEKAAERVEKLMRYADAIAIMMRKGIFIFDEYGYLPSAENEKIKQFYLIWMPTKKKFDESKAKLEITIKKLEEAEFETKKRIFYNIFKDELTAEEVEKLNIEKTLP